MQSERNKDSGQGSGVRGQLTDVAAASRVSDLHPSSFILPPFPRPRRAFTLTELLVVIAIIAVLAAMVSVGVMRALDTAKQTRIKTEVDQLDAAFKSYREKYGSFPPCIFNTATLTQHLARAFPRYDMSDPSRIQKELVAAGIVPARFRPDQALVFWLKGFSPDPANPFVTVNGNQITYVGNAAQIGPKITVTPLFDFDKSRLAVVAVTGTMPSYFPQGTKTDATGAPYLYWDAGTYATPPMSMSPGFPDGDPMQSRRIWNDPSVPMPPAPFPDAGPVIHYGFDENGNGIFDTDVEKWANPDSFQIISAGMDGKYTSPPIPNPLLGRQKARLFPTGTNYDVAGADDDNVTNFSAKARLGDSKP